MIRNSLQNYIKIDTLWFLAGLITSTSILMIANSCGPGFTSDSYLYIKIADQIKNQGLLQSHGLEIKPPIYPLLIHFFSVKHILTINVFCFIITFCTLFYFAYELKGRAVRYFYWSILIFSTPLYTVHSFSWTEPPFLCLFFLAIFFLIKYQKEKKLYFLYLATFLMLILPFVRFAGIFITVPLFLILFFRLPGKNKWRIAGTICLAALLFSFWVLLFNDGFHQRWRTFTTPFNSNVYSRYSYNISSYLEAISIWIVPLPVYKPVRLLVATVVMIGIGMGAFNPHLTQIRAIGKRNYSVVGSIPLIFLIYYVALHLVFPVEYYSAERYLTPFYNLLILVFLIWYESNAFKFRSKAKRVLLIFAVGFLFYTTARTVKNIYFWNEVRCVRDHVGLKD